MENAAPLISVIMPLHNASSTLEKSIYSVIGQSFPDWELLIIDDNSTDDTALLLDRLKQSDKRIKVISLFKQHGAAYARNYGLSVMTGRYAAFLDGDDTWHEEKLEKQVVFMESTNAILSFTGYSRFSEAGRQISRIDVKETITYQELLSRNVIGLLTVMIDTNITGQLSMPLLERQHDYGLWLKLINKHGKAYGLDENLASYQVLRSSLSSNKILAAMDVWTLFRKYEKLSFAITIKYFVHYAYYGLRYRLLEKFIK